MSFIPRVAHACGVASVGLSLAFFSQTSLISEEETDPMTIQVDLNPGTEARLKAEARAKGLLWKKWLSSF